MIRMDPPFGPGSPAGLPRRELSGPSPQSIANVTFLHLETLTQYQHPTGCCRLPARRDCSSTPEGGDMLRSVVKAAAVLLAVVLAVPAWATTAVERSEADMIKESAMIVTGRCIHLQSQWAGKVLVTLATIEVSEALKGKAGSTVTVALPGGVDANRRIPIAMNYPAGPVILQQEKVLLFLTPQQLVAGSYSVVGYSQ